MRKTEGSKSVLMKAYSFSQDEDEDFMSDYSSECSDVQTTSSHHSVPQQIARKESTSVGRWKRAISFMLLIVAAFMVSLTYIFLHHEESRKFKNEFKLFSYAIERSLVSRANNLAESLEGKADDIASLVTTSEEDWPFVTIPHVETSLEHLRNEDSSMEAIAFAPLVEPAERKFWNKYSQRHQKWINESLIKDKGEEYTPMEAGAIKGYMYSIDEDNYGKHVPIEYDILPTSTSSAPLWQMSPPPVNGSSINYDFLSDRTVHDLTVSIEKYGHGMLSGVAPAALFLRNVLHRSTTEINNEKQKKQPEGVRKLQTATADESSISIGPRSLVLQPIFDLLSDNRNRTMVGLLVGVFSWDKFLTSLLSEQIQIDCVIRNSCGEIFSYEINGERDELGITIPPKFLGFEDIHNPKYNKLVLSFEMTTDLSPLHGDSHSCEYEILLYPTSKLVKEYKDTMTPNFLTVAVAVVFMITFFMFKVFIGLVDKRQEKVMTSASQANAVVKSLFPRNVRDRIMKDTEEQDRKAKEDSSKKSGFFNEAAKRRLKSFLDEEGGDGGEFFNSKPIADLFPAATVLFADIVGFTAWSSVREPSQVFILLETIYHSFDQVAKRRRVFKVETIGDCYLAVTGLPDPRKDHAVVMARFARECLNKMHAMTKKLEVTLGPDTTDLSMRFGLHSGPVTAGVLRGEKSRFQLFGDTVNTAARMESNGARGRIHISQETANLLIEAGKSSWVTEREDKIVAKGKGELTTFWLQLAKDNDTNSVMTSSSSTGGLSDIGFEVSNGGFIQTPEDIGNTTTADDTCVLTPKMQRLVDWNVDQLSRLLKLIVVRRKHPRRQSNANTILYDSYNNSKRNGTVLEEVKEVITLPNFDASTFKSIEGPDSIELSSEVMDQLHDYVTKICMMYRNIPFHNFEHASHVTMSVSKLLARIVAPELDDKVTSKSKKSTKILASALHDHTYGITSDPLTQFSCVFSALIHDVDHTGVPNSQLVKESTTLALRYKNKSVAEQNSVDIAWDLLMDSKYSNLRKVIYASESELIRFRQLIVNSVMATDIFDKELKDLRNARWYKAFNGEPPNDVDEDRNRKATIVIEHLIQASDIAHTMQHWHIYRKWNERLFKEMYLAYKTGRAEKDPSTFWYKGEIGFFDFYIIPLARKLKDCGVFGVSSDEYLNYAVKNRQEWEIKGADIVKDLVNKMQKDEVRAPPKEVIMSTPTPRRTSGKGGFI